jgi:hypothetical protein
MSTAEHSQNDASPLLAFAKVVAIAAAGSALIMGTALAHVVGHQLGQEPNPWVSVHHSACGAYDLAVSTGLGTVHLRLAA